jgi:hypothetical protein
MGKNEIATNEEASQSDEFCFVVILSPAVFQAERRIFLHKAVWFRRSLGPLEKARAFGMTTR